MRTQGHATVWVLYILAGLLVGGHSAQSSELDDVYSRIMQEEQKKKAEQDRPKILAGVLAEDMRKYQGIVDRTRDNPPLRKEAWEALCKRWAISPIPARPTALAWDVEGQRAVIACKVKINPHPVVAIAARMPTDLRSFRIDGKPATGEFVDELFVTFLSPGEHVIEYEYTAFYAAYRYVGRNTAKAESNGVEGRTETGSVRFTTRTGMVTVLYRKMVKSSFWTGDKDAWFHEYLEDDL